MFCYLLQRLRYPGNMRLSRRRRITSYMVATSMLRVADRAGACSADRAKRVSATAAALARQVGMRPLRRSELANAALLVDIGMVACADEDDEELHPMRSAELVRHLPVSFEVLNGILHHHERYNGTGYPMGLAGREIPEFARILAIADAAESMSREEIDELAGTAFDPYLVAAYRVISHAG
jgi:HD-GYP domain-containing protein (c-di-GMP phosphodiesterase class II)